MIVWLIIMLAALWAAFLQAALLAFPALVQSYWREVVFVVVAVVVVRDGVAADVAPLQAALLALPGFVQS